MSRIFDVGYKFITKEGYEAEVIEFVKANAYKITFTDFRDVIKIVPINSIKNRTVKNPYHPNTFGVGYLGVGGCEHLDGNKMSSSYILWTSILRRSYYEPYKEKQPTYKNVTCCKEWHNFQNFNKWYENNYPYEVEGIKFQLDKDVLQLNVESKIYSPETCVFLPDKVNKFMTNIKITNTSGIVGVNFDSVNGNWIIRSCDFNTGERKQLKSTKFKENLIHFKDIYKMFRLKNIEYIKIYLIELNYLNETIIDKIINSLIKMEDC